MNEEYMTFDDIQDLLTSTVLYTPELVELIAGDVARINAADIGYTAYLSISGYVSVSILRDSTEEITVSNIAVYQLFRSDMIRITDAAGLSNLWKRVKEYSV